MAFATPQQDIVISEMVNDKLPLFPLVRQVDHIHTYIDNDTIISFL